MCHALEEILLRVSSLAEDFPEIAELDCNPVIVLNRGRWWWMPESALRAPGPGACAGCALTFLAERIATALCVTVSPVDVGPELTLA